MVVAWTEGWACGEVHLGCELAHVEVKCEGSVRFALKALGLGYE